MAKRLTQAEKEERTRAKVFVFEGGPRHGDSIRLTNPPPLFMRLALPEWCNYEWDARLAKFVYTGSEKPVYDRNKIL